MSSRTSAIVLAAGIGSRMKFTRGGTPKTLLTIRKHRIIDQILGSLASNNVSDVRIVTGYRAQSVLDYISNSYHMPDFDLTFVYNPWFRISNTACSLWLASAPLGQVDTVIVNGDVIIDEEAVRRLLSQKGSSVCCVRRKCGKEEVKVLVHGSSVVAMGKSLHPSRSWGEYIGLAKISCEAGSVLKKALQSTNTTNHSTLFYDDVINSILNVVDLRLVDVSDLAITEIDTREDLNRWMREFGSENA
jgi:choline kinase